MKINLLVPCCFIFACLALMVSAAHADVGRTPGSAEVSPTGTANYTVPIWTPPGSGGMTPSLALSYSHLTDNGLVGAGWRIGGLSIITRCNKTYAQDGIKSGPQLVAGDAYCLDGNKLRLESGTPGTNGAVYRTEMETYARVTAFGTAGAGPAWFQVQTKDGVVYEYGNTVDSRIVTYGTSTARLWAVSSVRDPSGNRTEYVYVNDAANGSYRPDEIRYATNPNAGLSSAPYAVKFVYENRPDALLGYAFGSASADGRVNEFKRLDRIEVRYQGNPVRIYDVAYGAGTYPSFRSLVQSITECSTSLANCLAPSSFTYTRSSNPFYEAEVALGTPVSGCAMDVNGDGREDWVYASQGTWRFRLSLGATLGTEVNTGITYGNMATWMPIDWDGDGRKDILSGVTGGFWQVVRANGLGGFDPTVSTGTAFESGATYSTMDQNGDGRDDLLRLPPAKNALYVHYRQGTGFAAPVLVGVALTDTSGGILFDNADKQRMHKRWLDFNGDGLEDGFIRYQGTRVTNEGGDAGVVHMGQALMSGDGPNGYAGGTISMGNNYQQPIWFGDFNGDGLTDIATPGFVHLSQGRAFVTVAGPWFDTIVGGVLDYDGDGRDDLILRPSGGPFCALYGNGSTLDFCADTEVGVAMSSIAVADVSGDGFADLIGTNYAGQFVLQLHDQTPVNLLLTATDGFNVSATFTYAPLTDSSVYVKGTTAVYPTVDIQTPSMVVKKLRKTDGSAPGTSFYDLDYTYSGARYDHEGRGFLGFASRSITDSRAGYSLRTLETYTQYFPYIGALQSVEVRQSDGTLIRSSSHTWSVLSWGTPQSDARKFPYVIASTLREYEVVGSYKGTLIRTIATAVVGGGIDATSGLIKDVMRTTTEVATGLNTGATHTERHVHTSVFNDTANWCLGKPEQTQLINSHTLPGGVQVVRTRSASWDGIRCRPTQTVEEPGSVQWQVAKAYGYDNFGNVNAVTVTPASGQGQAARTTTIDWGTDGRFPRTVTNAKGHITQLQWDAETGACTAGTSYLGTLRCITDANGLKTRFDVDAFGRTVRQQRPDGTATDYVLGACNASNSYCGSADLRSSLQIIARDTSNNAIRTDSQYFDAFDRPRYVYQQILGGGNSGAITQYDALGRVSSQSMPFTSGDPTTYTTYAYDLLGRPTSMQRQTSEVDTSLSTWQIAYQGLTTVVTDPLGHSRTTVESAGGGIVQAIDAAGGDTDYEFDAFGNLLKTRDFYGNEITLTYNVRGMKMSSSDPDMGNWTYDYFPLGELKKQTDAKGQEVTFSYDALSRPVLRHEPEGDTNWYWDTATNGIGQLDYVTSPGGYVERYFFDNSGRPYQNDITADGTTYSYNTAYNSAGLAETLTYPVSTSGVRFKVRYGYQYGLMQQVRDYTGDVLGTTFWQANAANARNQVLDTQLGNGLRTIDSYDRITGQLDSRTSGPSGDTTIQNLAYDYNKAGWLTQRQDLRQNLTEAFNYDTLGRMTSSTLNGVQNLNLTYDAIGNILTKSNVTSAAWTYDTVKKHAVKTAGSYTFSYDANGNVISDGTGGTISWYSHNLPNLIQSPSTVGAVSSQILYGHARQRYKQIAIAGPITETTIYIGGLLRKVTFSGTTSWKHAITTDTGIVAYHTRQSSGSNDTQYFTKDHLGSIDSITNAAGGLLVRLSFDAFGKRRKEAGWSGNVPTADETAITGANRDGYTGHEMLDSIGMVHMNGRVYYPKIGRFLSPDPYVQAPYNAQSLNRYSYVLNSPLSYVDPSGFNWDVSLDFGWIGYVFGDDDDDDSSECQGDADWCARSDRAFDAFRACRLNTRCLEAYNNSHPWPAPTPTPTPTPEDPTPEPPVDTAPRSNWINPGLISSAAIDIRKTAQPTVDEWGTVDGDSKQWEPPMEEPLRGGFSDLLRSLVEWSNGDCGQTTNCLTFPMWGTPRGSGISAARAASRVRGPAFDGLRDHAVRHSALSPNAYYNAAVRNLEVGTRFTFRHDGQFKNAFITRTGPDSFTFTSASRTGDRIFTHIDDVSAQYLRNIGITLPRGF